MAPDVTLLINNAGIPGSPVAAERRLLAAARLDDARLVMETDCWRGHSVYPHTKMSEQRMVALL